MKFISLKKIIIIGGDVAILYGSLILTLIIRYGLENIQPSFYAHLKPFSIIFIVWILIFYLFDLYSDRFLKYSFETIQNFLLAIIASAAFSIFLFYIFEPIFKLTPKTNLFVFALIFAILNYSWRTILAKIFIARGLAKKIIFIGDSPNIPPLIKYLEKNPQIGYGAGLFIKIIEKENLKEINNAIANNKIETVIISSGIKKDPQAVKFIYGLLPLQIKIFDLPDFYESIFHKIPTDEIEESWFIEQISASRHFYDSLKRFFDVILSSILIIILLPIMALIFILNKITFFGPAIYKQERTGKNNKLFILYKFRTMTTWAGGKDGTPAWTVENDQRITRFGKILRYTHLDELPQLFNILKGDMSFIGPRPESSNLVAIYKQLPHYEIRHIIKPGLTGWAQVNYKPSASIEEAKEKLQYDIYYIKNRSLFLDILILFKTIKYIFISHQ